MLPKLTFVLGGAASGKSQFAEGLVKNTGKTMHYVATAQVLDPEMETKVARHRKMRGSGWITTEAATDLSPVLGALTADDVALVDCATLWLSNHMMNGSALGPQTEALIAAVKNSAGRVVIVSNEVGQGIVPDNAMARQFREAQGRLNIALAAQSDLAIFVVAGLPQVLKGQLP